MWAMNEEKLDEVNFKNLVWFYQDELMSLSEGARVRDIFPKGLRRRLLNLGILVYKHGRSGLRYFISAAASELLKNIPPASI